MSVYAGWLATGMHGKNVPRSCLSVKLLGDPDPAISACLVSLDCSRTWNSIVIAATMHSTTRLPSMGRFQVFYGSTTGFCMLVNDALNSLGIKLRSCAM